MFSIVGLKERERTKKRNKRLGFFCHLYAFCDSSCDQSDLISDKGQVKKPTILTINSNLPEAGTFGKPGRVILVNPLLLVPLRPNL